MQEKKIKFLKDYADRLAKFIFSKKQTGEQISMFFQGELSLFHRFSQAKIRQSTYLDQFFVNITWQHALRSKVFLYTLSYDFSQDCSIIEAFIVNTRKSLEKITNCPYLVPMKNNGTSSISYSGKLLDHNQTVNHLLSKYQNIDLVGIYTSGQILRGVINSEGTSHWFDTENFFIDYSIFNNNNSIKSQYAHRDWNDETFDHSINKTKQHLDLLKLSTKKISQGKYRVYLQTNAVASLIQALYDWGGFSQSAYEQGSCPFADLIENKRQLSSLITFTEDFSLGLSPAFNRDGELSPDKVTIIDKGQFKTMLISAQTKQRYGQEKSWECNYANSDETPRSLSMTSGILTKDNILAQLDTGIIISNLWYNNLSNQQTARFTGMTRFAAFWVENGKIIAPIEHLRYDISLFEVLGNNLIAVGQENETIFNISSYYNRSVGGNRFSGLLVNDFNFTL